MKVKITNDGKRIIGECISIIFLFVISICACLSDVGIFKIPSLFILKIANQEDLFFNLFGVQATISSVGIAIIALLSGTNTESVYGICFSRYIAHIKPKILKHNRLIIINLIITFVNYFAVSYQLFNLSIALFFISILISIKLVKDTYVVFLGRKEIKKQIEQYFRENYDSGLLEDFSLELNDPEQLKNLSYTKENFDLLETIFEKEITKVNVANRLELLELLLKISTEASRKILRKNEPQLTLLVLNYLLNIYTIKNEKNPNITLQIWDDIIPEYYDSLSGLMKHQLSVSGVFSKFHKQLYYNRKNIDDESEYILDGSLKYYSTWLYNALKNNQHQDSDDMKRLTKRIYDNITWLFLLDDALNDKKKNILMAELCIFGKNLIDSGDLKSFEKLYMDTECYPNEKYKETLLIVELIYMYYLICREKLADNTKEKGFAEKIIKQNKENIGCFLKSVNIGKLMELDFDFIQRLVRSWEIIPEGNMKTMVIDKVINDFFVFVALEGFDAKNNLKQALYNICPDNTFSIYISYFSGEGKRVVELFSEFRATFFDETEDTEIEEKIDLLRNVLYEKYRKEAIKEGIEEQLTENDKLKFSELMLCEFDGILNENLSLLSSQLSETESMIKNEPIYNITGPSMIYRGDKIDTHIAKGLESCLIRRFIATLGEHIKVEKADSCDRDIQERFIDLVKTYEIKGDTYLGNRDTFWEEENSGLLKEFVSSMKNINFSGGYNQLYIIDSTLIEFKYSNMYVEFENLTKAEIEEKCKVDEEGNLMYNITNDIYIPFEEGELTEHVHRTWKRAKVYVDIYCKVDGIVGAGMIIQRKGIEP